MNRTIAKFREWADGGSPSLRATLQEYADAWENDLNAANRHIEFLLSRLRELEELRDALRVIAKHMRED